MGVPQATRFATKIALAKRLLARAFDAGVPARWVVGDPFYGRSHALRAWLEDQGRAYALMNPQDERGPLPGAPATGGGAGGRGWPRKGRASHSLDYSRSRVLGVMGRQLGVGSWGLYEPGR